MDIINEWETCVLTCVFKDNDSSVVTPTFMKYWVNDVKSGTKVLNDTTVVMTDATATIEVDGTNNRILTSTNIFEDKELSIQYTFGGGTRDGRKVFRWRVLNQDFITT